ncbi:MAG: hypothetical protein HZB31_04570 [Nitrospirae bacterium]|nr:hypothetical protein [Nitrospirota bacterium]
MTKLLRGKSSGLGRTLANAVIVSLLVVLLSWSPAFSDNAFAPPVSVTFPYTIDGIISARPVSVSFTGTPLLDGPIYSNPVSVSFTGTPLADGALISPAVSVSWTSAMFTDTYSSAASVVINGFLGLWHFDNNWSDASGNSNTGTISGGAVFNASGKADAAAGFNGTTAYVDFGSSNTLCPPHGVTLETWIKINSGASGSMYIAGNTDETTLTGYGLFVQANGTVAFKIGDGSWHTVAGTTVLTQGLWYHIAGSYDGEKLRLYINGLQDNEAASGALTIKYQNSFRAAYHPGTSGAGYFSGLIDELAAYNRPLSFEEVLSHYRNGKIDIIAPAAPMVNTVSPLTRIATVSLSGTKDADSAIWVNSTRIVPLDSSITWQGAYTLQYGPNTLKVTAVDAADNQSSPVTLNITLDNQSPTIESSVPVHNSNTASVVNNITIVLVDTYSAINLEASFANATVKNLAGLTIAGSWAKSEPKTIIFAPTSPLPQDTYTVTISPTDALDNTGTKQIVFTNHDTTPPVTTISLSGTPGSDGWYSTPVTVTLAAVDSADGSGIDKTEFSLDGTTWSTYTAPFAIDTDGTTTVRYRSRDNAGNLETTKTKDVKLNKAGIVGQWHMDNDWLDSSVMGKNGTPYNGTTFSTDAKVGASSGSFDGADDYVAAGLNGTAMNTVSVEMWIMRKSAGNKGIFQWANTLSSTGPFIYFYDANGTLQMYMDGNYQINTSIDLNNWHHIVLTHDGSVWRLYKDGSFVSSYTGGRTWQQYAANVYFGNGYHGYWNGLIDEVTIYNRALSTEEIQTHYQTSSIAPPTVDPVVSPTVLSTVSLFGTKPADTSVFVNGTEVYPFDGLTAWQGTYALQPGSNTLNITAKDGNGYHSQPAILTVVRDNTSPTISSSAPANNAFVNSPIATVTIQLTDAFSSVDLAATKTGASVKNSLGEDIPGTWTPSGADTIVFTPTASFGVGTYTVTVFPTDSLGNASSIGQMITFTYDINAPSVPTINTVTSPTRNSSQTITGTKTADTAAVIVASSTATIGAVSYPSSTTWSVTVANLQQGSNTITAYAKDAAGNQSDSTTAVILYDITPPVAVTIDVDSVQSPTKNSTVTMTGTKEANTDLYVNNTKSTAAFVATSWSYTANLSEGLNTFSLYSRDAAGNQGLATNIQVIKDTTPPRIASSVPAANSRINQVATIDVAFVDDNSTVNIGASPEGTVSKNSNTLISGIWNWNAQNGHAVFTPDPSFNPLADGVYTVSISPVDVLGNRGTASFSFTVDTAPPVVQSLVMSPTSPHKAEVVAFTITFNKAMTTGTQPVVSFGSTLPYTQWPLAGGTWIDTKTWRASYTFTASMGDGNYTIKITSAQDSLGNQISSAEIGTFVLDTMPPVQPTVSAVISPTKTATQTISGTKPADTAIVINGVQKVALDASTTWSCVYTLSEGLNSLSITARDLSENDSTPANVTITLDSTPPVFTVDTYKTPWAAATQNISGRKEPGSIVKINEVQIFGADDLNSKWSFTVNLSAGITNHFVLTASDALGNTTSTAIDIVSDNKGPKITAFNILQGEVFITPVTISASATDSEAGMARMEIAIDGTLVKVQTGGSVSYYWNIGETPEGNHSVKVAAYDQLGNVTEETRQVIVDLAQVIDMGQVMTTAIDGDYLYTAHGSATPPLSVFSLDDPLNPALVSTYGLGPVNAFTAGGTTGIGTTWASSLVSLGYDGAIFTKLSDIVLPRSAIKSVSLRGQYGFYCSGLDGWGMVEVSAEGTLSDMGVIKSGFSTSRVIDGGGYIFSANGTGGLGIYKIETVNAARPSIIITSPASGSSIPQGAEVEIKVDVVNGDSASVTFLVNDVEMFVDESAPFSYRFRAPNGATTLTLKARAYNLSGLWADSPEIVLTVN